MPLTVLSVKYFIITSPIIWSEAAATSKYVSQEWEHALSLGREAQNFIRPVYLKQSMPTTPPELGHSHFAYQPGLDD